VDKDHEFFCTFAMPHPKLDEVETFFDSIANSDGYVVRDARRMGRRSLSSRILAFPKRFGDAPGRRILDHATVSQLDPVCPAIRNDCIDVRRMNGLYLHMSQTRRDEIEFYIILFST
jgi:hypothetical protein